MAIVIALTNQKGGVAKTSSCMSIGACLAENGSPTLIVDLDPQAHLTMAAGLQAEKLTWSLADILDPVGPIPPFSAVIKQTAAERLKILPADIGLAKIERALYDQSNYEMALAKALKPLAEDYAYILLDCPPSLGVLTLMSLTAADWALIPVQTDFFASQGVISLLNIIAAVRERTNPALNYALFVSMYDSRTLVSRQVLEQLRDHFKDQLFETIIRTDTRLRESIILGEPVTVYAPKTRASKQYRALAAELIKRISGKEAR